MNAVIKMKYLLNDVLNKYIEYSNKYVINDVLNGTKCSIKNVSKQALNLK